jgi:hypothetical protein
MPEASGEHADLLHEAEAELYSSDPAQFVERRGALAAQARAAGQAAAAKSIAALRKPTRSAWVINQLIRSDADATSRLIALGDELRAAQGSLDGAAIRELSTRRRQLIAELSRQAFTASGLASPPAALRDEVTATLGAALADPQLARQLAAGTLERPAQAEGFGPAGAAGAPVLTVLPGGRQAEALAKTAPARPSRPARRPTAQERAEAAAQARAEAAAREQAERERRRQAALDDAERAVAEADAAAATASTAELDLEASVQRLEQELADARQGLSNARLAARRARNRQRQARQARDRLGAGLPAPGDDPRKPRIR